MQISNKWIALAIAHLVILTSLTITVIFIAVRLIQRPTLPHSEISVPTAPPSDAEIARLHLLQTRIDVMQYNLANADTTGFKRQLVNIEAGSPPKISDCHLDMTQGGLQSTGANLDVAIQGDGFFHIKVSNNTADGTGYTRNGSLFRNANGDLVVAIGEGYHLIPPINLPINATDISIQQDGTVTFHQPASGKTIQAGQIQLCHFLNPQMLIEAQGFYTETVASSPAIIDNPGSNGVGSLCQGFLESSNVDPLKEWADIQRAQKMLQFTSQVPQINEKAMPVILSAGRAGRGMQ